ncbi:hypothetical protein QRX60_23500 [Amycolatopsis mongoliensis]|uniref:Uncharacterized protein n=1 Tax=Amycolatopsis mongoliensis TaxID=715475 RepID=A0A9Y2JYU2_9PSEU|nr:hypothetical protein [Amycolatopsis sp. 4-36]WIY06668.1 hypothetical protein QRX60_23500 [Amycolatopsis sp. 4-36]
MQLDDTDAVFTCAPSVEDHTAARVLPRVWPGRGLGLPKQDIPGFVAALGEVMKTRRYWQERQAKGTRADPDDGFGYVSGPCSRWENTAGYRPVYSFSAPLPDVRGLRIRFSAYLRNRDESQASLH